MRERDILCFVFGKSIEISVFMPVVFHEHFFFNPAAKKFISSHYHLLLYESDISRSFFSASHQKTGTKHIYVDVYILQCGTP